MPMPRSCNVTTKASSVASTRQVVARHAASYVRAGAQLRLDGPKADARGRWDRARLELVLDNLLTNALKYGGGQPVDVRVEATDDAVVVTVQDRGIGIEQADQARIFDKFERAVTERRAAGSVRPSRAWRRPPPADPRLPVGRP